MILILIKAHMVYAQASMYLRYSPIIYYQCALSTVPGASLYWVPQYGQVAVPPCDRSRNTRGCDDHSGMAGLGQWAGKSVACSSIIAAGVVACMSFSGGRQYAMILTDYSANEGLAA